MAGVDITKPWVVDNPLSKRYPLYTRANIAEVYPNVATPLGWTIFAGIPGEVIWRRALAKWGAFDVDEFDPDNIVIAGVVHGYVYINVSVQRILAVRTPGVTPDVIDQSFFGTQPGIPPYQPQPGDDDARYSERIVKSMEAVAGTESRADLEQDSQTVEAVRAQRPDFSSMSNAELVARSRSLVSDTIAPIHEKNYRLVYESSIPTGMLYQALAPLDDPNLAVRLMAGLGNVDSAAPSAAMWDLGRTVAASPALSEEFDQGMTGLLERLQASASPDSKEFLADFDRFLLLYGSRGVDEWEIGRPTWETHPEHALALIDRMRLQPADGAPLLRAERLRQEREELTAEIRKQLSGRPEQLAAFDAALRIVSIFVPARERAKTNVVRVWHEARLPLLEVGRRMAEAGHFARFDDIVMLRDDELDAFLEDPAAMAPVVAERREWYEELQQLEPPFIIDGEAPPVETWPKKKEPSVSPVQEGEVLPGIAACPGTATGAARVVLDASDATSLEPGEILVAPMTDPGWTPLFVSAAAVVVDVGAQLGHAAIVSRELGIPCVVSVQQASKRIKTGTRLTVDGAAGTITVH